MILSSGIVSPLARGTTLAATYFGTQPCRLKVYCEATMGLGSLTNMRNIFGLALVIIFSVSCMTTDPYTGEQKVSKTAKGAGIGAATGAIIGAATGKGTKGALIGAAAGAAIGGGVGNYMDRQDAKLREQLAGTGVSVTRQGDYLYLNMPGDITFEVNRSDVRASFYPVLDSVGQVFQEFKDTDVHIIGYTDSTGSDAYNQELSEKRASSVAQYLQSRGIAAYRLRTTGMGKRDPIATNDTPEGRAQNRRIKIEIIPRTQ